MLRCAFDGSPVGVAVLDDDTAVLAANPMLEAMLAREPGALVGTRLTDLVDTRVQPGGGAELAEFLLGAAGDGDAGRREVCLRAANGAMVWTVLRRTIAAPTAGGAPRVVVHATELGADRVPVDAGHELDELMRSLIDASGFGVAVGDLDHHILQVNRQLCEILGYSEAELTSMTFEQITHPEDWSKSLSYVSELRDRGTQRQQTIKRYTAKDGRAVYCRRALYAGRGRDGVIRSVMVVIEPRGSA